MFRIKLSVLSGDDGIEDKVFERRDGEVKLGRASKSGGGEEPSPRNGLFRNALTSRSHCSLVWHTEGIDIKDHSSHGTIIKRESSSTHIKDGSMRLEHGDTICLGKEIQKTQSDGRKIGHEAVCIKVSIEHLPESPKHSSPYRLELREQLASDVEEDELKSDNVVPDNNQLDVSGDIITTEISTAVRIETEVALTEQEEVAGSLHQEMQRATSDQPPSSPLSAYQSSEVRLRSSSPGAEDAVQPASSKISKLFSYLSRETSPAMPEEAKESVAEIPAEQTAMLADIKETSPDVTSQTLSAEVSPNKPVQGETATTSALPLFLPSTPDPAGNPSNPQQKMRSGMRGPLPVALERVQIVRQSPSVSSRKNRYLGAIQQLNKGGIDQETAASPIGGSARKSFSKGVTATSSRQASEDSEQRAEASNLFNRQQSTSSTIEIPDSQIETEGAELLGKDASPAAEATTSKAEAGAASMKRKADEIEAGGYLTEVNMDERPGTTARPTKRVRKSGIWKKVAANTGVFALGAVTAMAGLLLWPEED